jgi:hypothetical protein
VSDFLSKNTHFLVQKCIFYLSKTPIFAIFSIKNTAFLPFFIENTDFSGFLTKKKKHFLVEIRQKNRHFPIKNRQNSLFSYQKSPKIAIFLSNFPLFLSKFLKNTHFPIKNPGTRCMIPFKMRIPSLLRMNRSNGRLSAFFICKIGVFLSIF